MRQPRALVVLFLTEMWERYGFYIIQGLLTLYMINFLSFTDSHAYGIAGSYLALVYISPLLGGYMANNLFGYRRSIILGGVLLSLGYAIIAMHSHTMYWGLATIVLGNGFFKPNISSFLGDFYEEADARRESGFTIFYVGINLGGLIGTSTSGYIQAWLGWHSSFAMASMGMVLGLLIFIIGRRQFEAKGYIPASQLPDKLEWLGQPAIFAVILLVLLVAVRQILESELVANVLLSIVAISTVCLLIFQSLRFDSYWRNRMLALSCLIIFSVFFWALFFEQFDVINIFVDRAVSKDLFGLHIPTVAFISFEQISVIIFGPLMAWYWHRLNRKNKNPSVPMKFALSVIFLVIAYAVLYFGSHIVDAKGLVSGYWVIACYALIAIGEIFLSPIGLSIVTELAHPKLVGLMMGVWFMAIGFGGKLAGVLAKLGDVPKSVVSMSKMNAIYQQAFFYYMLLAVVLTILAFCMVPFLKRLMSTRHYR